MGQPEKEPGKDQEKTPENKPDFKASPKLDAIFPDDLPPAAAELVGDIDSYQQRMEKEWEAAKNSYEQKINRIMEEFAKSGATTEPEEKPKREEPAPKKSIPNDDRLKLLMGQLESELRRAGAASKKVPFFKTAAPEPMQLGWQGSTHPPWKKIAIAAGCAVTLTATLFFVGSFRVQVTPIPYAHTLGPVVAKDKIYILDWFRRALYVHGNSSKLPILSVESMPNTMATGFAMSEKYVWSLDTMDRKLLVHAVSSDHQVTSSVATPGSKPIGLFYDGLDVWSADQNEKMLYRHRGNDLEDIRDSFPLPDINATAILFNKNRLWILDGKSRLANVYRLQKPMMLLGSFDLDPFVKGASPTGFAIDGSKMLVVTENPALLLRIPLSRLKKSTTQDF